jgi:hypothetical protein
MKEFMFYIRNAANAKASLSPEEHLTFVKSCEMYIHNLKAKGILVAAQPLQSEGIILSKSGNSWTKNEMDASKETQEGYYHILAESLDEAIKVAKGNPEFEYIPSAKIEIFEIKTEEEKTNYIYPK